MGDFNYPSIDWATRSVQDTASSEAQLFLDHLDDCFLTQHVQTPTRKKATLDLVITSEPELVHAVEVREPLEQSDHNMISWESHLDVCHRITNHRRLNYAKANLNGMRAELQQVDWDTLLSGDIHNSWSVFKNKVHELESKYIPTTTLKSKQTFKPIWMTNRTLKLAQRKRRIYSKYKNNDHPACKQANIEARKELRKSKRKFEKMLEKNIKNDKKTLFA